MLEGCWREWTPNRGCKVPALRIEGEARWLSEGSGDGARGEPLPNFFFLNSYLKTMHSGVPIFDAKIYIFSSGSRNFSKMGYDFDPGRIPVSLGALIVNTTSWILKPHRHIVARTGPDLGLYTNFWESNMEPAQNCVAKYYSLQLGPYQLPSFQPWWPVYAPGPCRAWRVKIDEDVYRPIWTKCKVECHQYTAKLLNWIHRTICE